jgi:hypothetical protein
MLKRGRISADDRADRGGTVMTGNAKSEALQPRKLSSEELDAVSGGDLNIGVGVCTNTKPESNHEINSLFATAKDAIQQSKL